MTISTTESRISYNGNSVTTVFSFPYRFLANGDLKVVSVSALGVETTKALTTDETLTGAGDDGGGSVTMLVAPATGTRLVIYRDTGITQETDYISGDPFPAETHERALDRLTMIAQEIGSEVDRAFRLPVSVSGVNVILPPPSASTVIGWSDDGLSLENYPLADATPVSAFVPEVFTATGGQTVFTLSNLYTPAGNTLSVFVNGLLVRGNVDYVETNESTVTFVSGLTVGDEVVFHVWRTSLGASGDSVNIGFLQSGTGAVATTAQAKLRESVSVKDFGSGVAAFLLALTNIGSTEKILLVNDDISLIADQSVPQNVTLRVDRGAVITINTGVTLTVLGKIEAGNYVIFDGPGTLNLNAGSAYFNIAWFAGEYLNDKWDFILRGLVSLRPYTVYVPKPELGMQGAVEVTSNLVYWGIDAPLLFPDKANGGQWISGPDVRIIATAVMDSMMEFSTDSKVEDITFPTGLWLIGDAKATYGMEFHGGSRIRSNGLVQITDCATCLYFDNVGGSNDKINLHSLYFARWTTSAIHIEGSGDSMVACNFPEIVMEVPGADLTNCIVVRGSTRNVDFGRVYYDTAGSGFSATNIILVQSTASGYSIGLMVDDLYAVSAAVNLVKIENSGGSQRAISTTLGKLTGPTGTVAANLNYDIYTSILEKPVLAVTYGSDCQEPKPNTNIITRTYDFAVSGGSIATYNLGGSLPNGCTVVRAWYRVETALTSGGAATVRIGITGTLAGIQAILAYDNAAYAVGLQDGIPNGTAATALTQVTNSTTFPSLVIAGAALTAGKITVYIEIVS